jgi:O-antigen/teichoic acid export membrane protein
MVVGRLMTLGFYAIMARKLGRHGFGDFNFALSLSVFVTISSLGTDFAITREVARDPKRIGELFGNAVAVRVLTGAVAVVLASSITFVAGYSTHVKLIVPIVATSAWLDIVNASAQAVLRGMEDMRPIAIVWTLERTFVAVFASGALLAGATLLPVTLIYLLGSVVGFAYILGSLAARGVRPTRAFSRQRMWELLVDSLPLAAVSVSVTVLARLDAVMLSLFKGNSAVGIYGAAYRPYEGSLIIPALFGLASYPVLARLTRSTQPTIADAYEKGCKGLALVMVPTGAGLALFATPIVSILYGHSFTQSAFPLRMMGIAMPVWAVLLFSTYMLASQDRQRLAAYALAVGAAVNIGANLLLIPEHSYDGAAIALVISIGAIAVMLLAVSVRVSGPIRPLRVVIGPVSGAAAMTAVAITLGVTLASIVLAVASYAAVVLAVETTLFREDVLFILRAFRRRANVPRDRSSRSSLIW